MAARNRAVRRYERARAQCKALGHAWGEKIKHYDRDAVEVDGKLHEVRGMLLGWSQECTRCGAVTGRGEF